VNLLSEKPILINDLKMPLKHRVFILFYLLNLVDSLTAEPTLAGTDWQLHQTENSLVSREVVIKSTISELQVKVEKAVKSVAQNTVTGLVTKSLEKLKSLLTELATVDTYKKRNEINCDNIALRASKMLFEIQDVYKTNLNVITNNTKVNLASVELKVYFAANYFILTNDQRADVQSVVTGLIILVDNYFQYSVALVSAAVRYGLLYIDLLHCKNVYCTCPGQLNPASSGALSTVDNSLKQILIIVENREATIRDTVLKTTAYINEFNSDIRKNPMLSSVSITLDNIVTILSGYLKLTTNEIINGTSNCDEAAMKVEFIKQKVSVLNQAIIEANINSSKVLVQLSALTACIASNYNLLSQAQRDNLQNVKTSLNNILEAFRQYVYTLLTASVKLNLQLLEARTARYGSCNCTDKSSTLYKFDS